MSQILEIRGNLFGTSLPLLAHGVNTRGAFASGLARQVAQRYPEVKRAYLRKFSRHGWCLGDIQVVKIDNFRMIANCGTQLDYGREPGRVYVDYDAIRTVMGKLVAFCEDNGLEGFAMPRIGCGLGGGDWAIVGRIIAEATAGSLIEVEIYSV